MKEVTLVIDGKDIKVTISEEELSKLLDKNSNRLWHPKEDEPHYFIDDGGGISWYSEFDLDNKTQNFLYKQGYLFKTKEEAQHKLDVINAEFRVRQRILELNNGWKPDWFNGDMYKFNIHLYHEKNGKVSLEPFSSTRYKRIPNGLYIKSQGLAKQLIEEMEDDLILILSQ
jgi:hypothetical protein